MQTKAASDTDATAPREHATPRRAPLRVGVFVDAPTVPRWIARTLDAIHTLSEAELALVLAGEGTPHHAPPEPTYGPARPAGRIAAALYALYLRLDARNYAADPDPFAPVELDDGRAGAAPLRRVGYTASASGEVVVRETDAARIRAHDLDVLLFLATGTPDRGLARLARHGVWRFAPVPAPSLPAWPAGFWEVLRASPTTAVRLEAVPADGGPTRALCSTIGRTQRMSVTGNNTALLWKCPRLAAQALRAEYHRAAPHAPTPRPGRAVPPRAPGAQPAPTAAQVLRLVGKMVTRRIHNRLRALGRVEQWVLAYHFAPERRVADGSASVPQLPVEGFHALVPPPDRFWADPFPVRKDGRYFIFCEEGRRPGGRGFISVIEIDAEGRAGPPTPVLTRDYHLSYPFIFEWQGDFYMLPETAENRTLELYRCTAFPGEWELHSVLLRDVDAVDATLHECDGTWWMFVNLGAPGEFAYDDELHLFHAPTPLGPWTPHRRNPVKSDVRSARPAGRLFRKDGVLYRPAQDCAERYGRAVVLHRIDRLDEDDYRETPIARLDPDWMPGLVGTHTLNAAGALTTVDGLLRRRR